MNFLNNLNNFLSAVLDGIRRIPVFRYAYPIVFIFLLNSCRTDKVEISYSTDKSQITAYNLVNPIIANKLLTKNTETYIPIQVSKENIFLKEHIPNAINIWRPDYGSDINEPYSGLIPSKEKLQNLLQVLGFEQGKTLLLYDVKANVDALRFAWVLNLYGFDNFKIINGGLNYWKQLGLPITSEPTRLVNRSKYQLKANFDAAIIANFEEVLASINDTNTILIDTREAYEYKGMPFIYKGAILPYKKGAFDRGSIPNAIHLNWSTLADLNGDHRIKSENDLRYDLERKGVLPDKNIILYCHSGSRTSHTYYVLKHVLDYQHVKNYDGSWIEWSYKHTLDNSIPIHKICTDRKFEAIKDSLSSSLSDRE